MKNCRQHTAITHTILFYIYSAINIISESIVVLYCYCYVVVNFGSNGTITNGKWNLSLSLIVRLSCQFNRVTFINVYWIILNDRLSFWLFDFFLDPYHMTKCTLQGRVWLPNFGTMCWVIGCIQCHMTHGKVLYTCAMCITWYCTIHHIVRFLTSRPDL